MFCCSRVQVSYIVKFEKKSCHIVLFFLYYSINSTYFCISTQSTLVVYFDFILKKKSIRCQNHSNAKMTVVFNKYC